MRMEGWGRGVQVQAAGGVAIEGESTARYNRQGGGMHGKPYRYFGEFVVVNGAGCDWVMTGLPKRGRQCGTLRTTYSRPSPSPRRCLCVPPRSSRTTSVFTKWMRSISSAVAKQVICIHSSPCARFCAKVRTILRIVVH